MKFKKGDNIILTRGEYSDYSILDGLVATVDFSTDAVVNMFLDIHPEQAGACSFDVAGFEEWLISCKVVKRIKHAEWRVCSYDEADYTELSAKHKAFRDAGNEDTSTARPEDSVSTSACDIKVAEVHKGEQNEGK